MMWTDNPVRDAERFYRQKERQHITCSYCDEEIVDDNYLYIMGYAFCSDCVDKHWEYAE